MRSELNLGDAVFSLSFLPLDVKCTDDEAYTQLLTVLLMWESIVK